MNVNNWTDKFEETINIYTANINLIDWFISTKFPYTHTHELRIWCHEWEKWRYDFMWKKTHGKFIHQEMEFVLEIQRNDSKELVLFDFLFEINTNWFFLSSSSWFVNSYPSCDQTFTLNHQIIWKQKMSCQWPHLTLTMMQK